MFVMVLCFCSQNPTADEILSWAQNFDKMMKTPAGRNLFREFLRTEYSEENLLFWLACEDLKKEQNKKVIEEKARLIYEDYISILSPKEVKQCYSCTFWYSRGKVLYSGCQMKSLKVCLICQFQVSVWMLS